MGEVRRFQIRRLQVRIDEVEPLEVLPLEVFPFQVEGQAFALPPRDLLLWHNPKLWFRPNRPYHLNKVVKFLIGGT